MLPADFLAEAKTIFADELGEFLAAMQQSPAVSVRLNDKFSPLIFDGELVPWCDSGIYLDKRPQFTLDPLLHAGAYYVQEAASMFLQQIVNQCVSENAVMLDLCAAPGGKSTLLAQHLSENGLLVANEYVRNRSQILSENLQKWGSDNVIVTNNAPADFADFTARFDAILVDAPCSGEGMFRKDEQAISEWSLANVQRCVERQQQILTDIWHTLKTDGILIYSTCTYNCHENEENVRWIRENLGAEIVKIAINPDWNIAETAEGYHFFPHRTRGEGLFVAVLRKTSDETPAKCRIKLVSQNFQKSPFASWLKNADKYALFEHRGVQFAFPKYHAEMAALALQKLNVLHFGVALAEQKGRDFVPQQSLALSKNIDSAAFNCCEVDLPTALKYLHCEALNLPNLPRGIVLITYQNLPIGWAKNVGNRCNNLYPQPWRIRHLELV